MYRMCLFIAPKPARQTWAARLNAQSGPPHGGRPPCPRWRTRLTLMEHVAQQSGPPGGRWAAPAAAGPVRARLSVPGSKSMTNRALVLAALADGPGTVAGPLQARDTLLMRAALTALGATITDSRGYGADPAGPAPSWQVIPGRPGADARVDVGNAGTVLRFAPPVAALTSVSAAFHGDARAAERPVGPMLTALRELGAVIDDGGRGALPFTVHGSGSLPGGAVTLDASASSQFVSGLLLAAPRFDKGAEIRHRGGRAPSAPHIAMTVAMLRDAGAEVETWARESGTPAGTPDTWRVHPGAIGHHDVIVQPDLSNAVPFLAAALVTGGAVTIAGWPAVTWQPAAQILDLLAAFGASCTLVKGESEEAKGRRAGGGELTVTGTGRIRPVTADLADIGESAPVAAALAALADGPSRLTGIGHIRRHETDRLAALATQLNALGGQVTELADGLEVRPRPLAAGPFDSYDDHRMVMAAAVLGLAVPGLEVADAATVGKTFPAFAQLWASMLERVP
jgi:3-phosphoshikimate 1-carboxyvinyltransferase